jgi:hypothetical protein
MLIRTRGTHDDGFIHPLASEITPRAAYEGRRLRRASWPP